MFHLTLVLLVLALAGCNTAATRDVSSPEYEIPSGSKIVLNKELNIPSGYSHIKLQGGAPGNSVDEYTVNCRFNAKSLGPAVIQPDTFTIREASSQRDWVSQPDIMRFYREFRIKSDKQPDVMSFVCQDWDGPMMGKPVSVPEMKTAVGTFVSFEFSL
jgi:hypothetical protein